MYVDMYIFEYVHIYEYMNIYVCMYVCNNIYMYIYMTVDWMKLGGTVKQLRDAMAAQLLWLDDGRYV